MEPNRILGDGLSFKFLIRELDLGITKLDGLETYIISFNYDKRENQFRFIRGSCMCH